MDGLRSPCIPELWGKSNVIIDHEAAASFFLPSCLPQTSRKRSRDEPTSDWAENALNATTEDSNNKSTSSLGRFPREKSRLRTAKTGRRTGTDPGAPGGTSIPVLLLSKVPSKDSREHSMLEWESHKGNIEQLYRVQELTLEEVREIMKRDYGFAATARQFKRRIKSWHFDKQIKSHEMEALVRKRVLRKKIHNKESAFRIRGVPVKEMKIHRYLKRRKTSCIMANTPSIEPATPSDLSYYTPKLSVTPPPSEEALKSPTACSSQTLSAQSSPLASALGLMQSLDQLRSGYGDVDIRRFSSACLPASYLPLGGLDEVIYLGSAEIQKTLQRIIYRLCSLALTHRNNIIAGQPRLVIAHLDQLLSLGFEDIESGREDRDAGASSPTSSALGPEDGTSLMEQYLLKIYEMLRRAQGMTLTKKPSVSDSKDFTPMNRTTCTAVNLRKTVDPEDVSSEILPKYSFSGRQYDSLVQWLGNTGQDWDWCPEQLLTSYSQLSSSMDTVYSFDMDLANESFNSEKNLMDSDYFGNGSGNRLRSSHQIETSPKASTKEKEQQAPCRRLRTFSLSRYTSFGRVDIMVQTKSSTSAPGGPSALNLANNKLEDSFEAKTIITSYENIIAVPQVIFKIGKKADTNNLSMPILSFRSTIPDNSKIFDVAKFGSPRDLQAMIYDGLASLNDCDTNGRSLLNHALATTNIEMCKFLLQMKRDVNAFEMDRFGQLVPLLHCLYSLDSTIREASQNRRQKCYELMLDAGADPSLLYSNTDSGASFLSSSFSTELWFGPLQALKALLDTSAPFVTPNSTGNPDYEEPPLLILARSSSYNNVDTAEKFMLLIDRGAKTNVYDSDRSNALHIVMRYMPLLFDARAMEEMYDILMILVTGRAYVYATNDWGETVSDVALGNGYRDIWIRVLEDCGYDVDIVLNYRKGPGVPRPTPRSKLSFKEYCQRRASSAGFGRVKEAKKTNVAPVQEGSSHGLNCKGPFCRLTVSSVSVDGYMCTLFDDDKTFCVNCKAFDRLIQFTTSDGRCRNVRADEHARRDDEQRMEHCEDDRDGNYGFEDEEKNDTSTLSNDDSPTGSNIDLKDFGLGGMDGATEEQDFLKLFINDDWEL